MKKALFPKTVGRVAMALALGMAAPALSHDARHHSGSHQFGGPADRYVYRLAEPGSYALPVIEPAADALLLDSRGGARQLSRLLDGRITVLAFVYTRCADLCPVVSLRLADLRALAGREPEIAARLQLISLSFDPEHDTPARMAEFAEQFLDEAAAPGWLFLTAPSQEGIEPVLRAYGQPVAAKNDPDDPSGPLSHLLRVFLIDAEANVRNIYSADFLDPRLVLNDIKTLLLDERAHRSSL